MKQLRWDTTRAQSGKFPVTWCCHRRRSCRKAINKLSRWLSSQRKLTYLMHQPQISSNTLKHRPWKTGSCFVSCRSEWSCSAAKSKRPASLRLNDRIIIYPLGDSWRIEKTAIMLRLLVCLGPPGSKLNRIEVTITTGYKRRSNKVTEYIF